MDRLYTVKQTAEILQTSEHMVRKLHKAGLLRGLILGKLKFREKTIEQFLETWDGCDVNEKLEGLMEKDDGMEISEPNNIKEL